MMIENTCYDSQRNNTCKRIRFKNTIALRIKPMNILGNKYIDLNSFCRDKSNGLQSPKIVVSAVKEVRTAFSPTNLLYKRYLAPSTDCTEGYNWQNGTGDELKDVYTNDETTALLSQRSFSLRKLGSKRLSSYSQQNQNLRDSINFKTESQFKRNSQQINAKETGISQRKTSQEFRKENFDVLSRFCEGNVEDESMKLESLQHIIKKKKIMPRKQLNPSLNRKSKFSKQLFSIGSNQEAEAKIFNKIKNNNFGRKLSNILNNLLNSDTDCYIKGMSEVGSPKKSLVKSVSPIKVEKNINNCEDNILELVRQNIETQSGLVRRLGVSSRQARIDIKKRQNTESAPSKTISKEEFKKKKSIAIKRFISYQIRQSQKKNNRVKNQPAHQSVLKRQKHVNEETISNL